MLFSQFYSFSHKPTSAQSTYTLNQKYLDFKEIPP